MNKKTNRGFTLVEVIVAMTLSLLILGGVMGSFMMFVRSSIRLANYDEMETQATRALEFLARDARMAQEFNAELGKIVSKSIDEITLKVPQTDGTIKSVVYAFVAADKTFVRTVDANPPQTLISNIVSGSGRFLAYNLAGQEAANRFETNQIKITMTASPDTKGLYASTTKRIISARFVLRNR